MDITIALIPILIVSVLALVVITWLYFRSKEKQMMIERGLSYEQMIEFMKSKRSPYTLLKIGIITVFFGFGLGIGLIIEVSTGIGEWIPFLLFAFTGAGFVAAFFVADKIETKKNNIKT